MECTKRALRDLLEGQYKGIMDTISQAPYIQMDESWIKINGKKGYVWLVTVKDATYIVVNPSRSAVVLDLHFSRLYDIPVVVDGYAAIQQVCHQAKVLGSSAARGRKTCGKKRRQRSMPV